MSILFSLHKTEHIVVEGAPNVSGGPRVTEPPVRPRTMAVGEVVALLPTLTVAEPVPTLTIPVPVVLLLPMVTVLALAVAAMETDPPVRLPPMVNAVVTVVPLTAVPVKTPPLMGVVNVVAPGKVTVPDAALPIVTFLVPFAPIETLFDVLKALISKLFPVTPMLVTP